ncbi:MAG TPA: STAS domain-containing protein [Candidatus Saccharimonadaceae bacterium]|jgi:anti-sigma B factor antagonist|nr:STAS domain-containing protein [Candidatus Saccharimonadaceae bacterium]
MFEVRPVAEGHVKLAGRLDAAEAERARPTLTALTGSVTLDLSELDYISSAGLGLLVETYKRLHAGGHSLRLVGLLPRVRNVFGYAGLDRIFTIE